MDAKKRVQTITLLSISTLGQFSIAVINFGIIFFLRDRFDLSASMIGTFAAVMTLCYFAGCLSLKKITSLLKPRHSVEIGALGMGLFGGLILFVPSVSLALICFSCYGFVMSFYWPPLMGWLTRGLEGRELSKDRLLFQSILEQRDHPGSYIAGLLTEADITYSLITAAVIMFLIVTIIVLTTAAAPSMRAVESSSRHVSGQKREDNSTPLRFVCWLGILAGYFLFGVTMNIFPIYARDGLLYSESVIGLFLLVRALVTTVFFVLLGRMTIWHFNIKIMYGIQLFLAATCLYGIYAKDTVSLFIFFILYGVAFAVVYTNSIFHGVAGAADRESRMAIHEAALTLGTILGSIFGGTFYQYGGYEMVMGIGIFSALLVLIIQMIIVKKFKAVKSLKPAQT